MHVSPLHPDAVRHLDEVLSRCPALRDLRAGLEAAAATICACHRAGGKVLVCGNGGSAADSEHIVGELAKGFRLPRALPAPDVARLRAVAGLPGDEGAELSKSLQQGVAAIALTGHPSLASAIDNDLGRHLVFAQQVYVFGRPGDVLIALSTSGNSANVIRALAVARAFGLTTIGLTGSAPAGIDALSDILLKVAARETHEVQELHLPAYHAICLMVEQELFGAPPS
jgi:D-sedoheptulose 7-phosphate isomerase